MVDAKEPEPSLDKEESPNNMNLDYGSLEGEPKSLPQPQNPNPIAESQDTPKPLRDASPLVEPQQQDKDPSPPQDEKLHQMPDPNSLQPLFDQPSNELTPATKPVTDSDILSNANGDANTTLDEPKGPQDVEFKYENNDDNGTLEASVHAHSKQLSPSKDESSDIHPLNDKSSQTDTKPQDGEKGEELKPEIARMDFFPYTETKKQVPKPKLDAPHEVDMKIPKSSVHLAPSSDDGHDSGTEEEQAAFMREVDTFYRENNFEFKAPKFYKEELNLLKLWRAVVKLGGYEQVTSCKLWRQVGESFRPPKTCTTVSWTFRIFYEKALLEYEKAKMRSGELPFSDGPPTESIRVENQAGGIQALGSGRAPRRDAAARAMQGWHSQRLLDNGQVCHPIIKNKNSSTTPKSDKQLKTNGLLKRKKPTIEHAVQVGPMKTMKQQGDTMVIDVGPPADWVKINVQRTNDCFEIYALVPGLLREEVHVQSDPAGRLIISGQPEQLDNPWGVTPFKKVVSLPSRIDPHQTSAVVTLHGQLFVRVPFEQSDL